MFRWNLATVAVEAEPRAREGHRFARVRLGEEAGAVLSGASLYELPPGEAAFGYHFELDREEWLLVVAGEPTLRTPEGDRQLRPGDVACFRRGPAGAHALRNDGVETARYLLLSERADGSYVAAYPDSDKILATDGDQRWLVRGSPQLDYWDGEG